MSPPRLTRALALNFGAGRPVAVKCCMASSSKPCGGTRRVSTCTALLRYHIHALRAKPELERSTTIAHLLESGNSFKA